MVAKQNNVWNQTSDRITCSAMTSARKSSGFGGAPWPGSLLTLASVNPKKRSADF